jgi:hypothetical protein
MGQKGLVYVNYFLFVPNVNIISIFKQNV